MNNPKVTPITATLEALIAECVGQAPELVKLQDWRTIALRLSRRMEESGLVIRRYATTPGDRGQLVGPIRNGEVVMVLADGPVQTIVFSTGAIFHRLPEPIQMDLWQGMLERAIGDLRTARAAQRKSKP